MVSKLLLGFASCRCYVLLLSLVASDLCKMGLCISCHSSVSHLLPANLVWYTTVKRNNEFSRYRTAVLRVVVGSLLSLLSAVTPHSISCRTAVYMLAADLVTFGFFTTVKLLSLKTVCLFVSLSCLTELTKWETAAFQYQRKFFYLFLFFFCYVVWCSENNIYTTEVTSVRGNPWILICYFFTPVYLCSRHLLIKGTVSWDLSIWFYNKIIYPGPSRDA